MADRLPPPALRGAMPGTVDALLDMLALDPVDTDRFAAPVTDRREEGRLFGGLVAAQALRAAALTVPEDRRPHSLHGYFLRPGRPRVPLELAVDRLRDGGSFTTRTVVARQAGEAIFELSASFHRDEPGREYATPPPADTPDPESDGPWAESPIAVVERQMPFEMRHLHPTPADERGRVRSTRRVWVRTKGPLPDDPTVHACILTFLSDMGAVLAAAIAVGGTFGTIMGASLDHAVWLHRPIRLDDWVCFDLRPASNAGARGLVQGTFHTRAGVHGASMAQEALIRPL